MVVLVLCVDGYKFSIHTGMMYLSSSFLSRLVLSPAFKKHYISPHLFTRIMSTFALPNSEPEIPVRLSPDLSQDQLLSFPAFKTWISTLQHTLTLQANPSHTFHLTPYRLRQIDIQLVDFFGGGKRIGFIKLQADISNDRDEKLPGAVFLRGGSIGMMVFFSSTPLPARFLDFIFLNVCS